MSLLAEAFRGIAPEKQGNDDLLVPREVEIDQKTSRSF